MTPLRAFLYGATVAISIGPIAMLIINRSLTRGFIHGIRAGFGAALGDLFFAVISFTVGGSLVGILQDRSNSIQVFSSWILIGLGLYLIFRALHNYHHKRTISPKQSPEVEIASVFLLTLSNPLSIIGFIGLIGQVPDHNPLSQSLILALSVFLGSLPIQLGIATAASLLHKFFQNPKAILTLNILSGLGIMSFGVSYFL